MKVRGMLTDFLKPKDYHHATSLATVAIFHYEKTVTACESIFNMLELIIS